MLPIQRKRHSSCPQEDWWPVGGDRHVNKLQYYNSMWHVLRQVDTNVIKAQKEEQLAHRGWLRLHHKNW